jgi:hypothetical protein
MCHGFVGVAAAQAKGLLGAFALLGSHCGWAADGCADTLACAARSWPKWMMGGGSNAHFAQPLGSGRLLVGLRCALTAQGECGGGANPPA